MIIWISSYPKSGNTLVRAMISSLLSSHDGSIDFKCLPLIPQYPMIKYFDEFKVNFDSIPELSKYWVASQKKIVKKNKIIFFKTHHNLVVINGNPFTTVEVTLGSIYIVRDPRNVFTSVKNHFSYSNEKTLEMMLNENWDLYPDQERTRVKLGSWKTHYNYWTKHNKNLLVIKYEDLVHDLRKELEKIIDFLNKLNPTNISSEKIDKCIETSTFENMKKLEKSGKFSENVANKNTGSNVNFFHLGKENKWQNLLNPEIRKTLEKEFKDEMLELGYL